MSRFGTLLLIFIVLSAPLCSCLEGRMVIVGEEKKGRKKLNLSSRESLFLSALRKGTVPSSSPSKKGHANEKHIEPPHN
ncbi:hypothetical protein Lal_00023726 [Lupinus albus]|uniref:Uncharacterized protein n=1 Tax=Lupinus albus TaxID=3870 RepID=A0A6A5NQW9_LUPAL|nr:hypothetical protein Lalb_Chr13g0295291 [Lupinus albus]KAF1887719.1 hypothetical protein Lal_00023726 [Lupinus albus]